MSGIQLYVGWASLGNGFRLTWLVQAGVNSISKKLERAYTAASQSSKLAASILVVARLQRSTAQPQKSNSMVEIFA